MHRIALFYFFLGIILQLPDLAVRFYLIDLGIGVATLGVFQATLIIPWCLKPFYGFISDSVLIRGLRRKPYIIACNVLCTAIWFIMAQCKTPVWAAQLLLFLASVMTCFSDVMYDSILVEIAKQEEGDDHGKTQSWCWGARAVGALVAAGTGGLLLNVVSPQVIFLTEACIMGIVAVVAYLLIDEKPFAGPRNTICIQSKKLMRSLRNPKLWRPALFVFIFAATPSSYTAFFYFLVNELQFSGSFLGLLTCVRHGAMLVGTFLYSKYLRNTNYQKFFLILVLISGFLGATPIILVTHVNARVGLPDSFFAVGDDLFLSVIGQIALMPCLVLAAKLCPQGIEASMYASFVSILNFAGIVSEYSGALCTYLMGVTKDDFTNLPYLILLCTLTSFSPLCVLGLLPKGNVHDLIAPSSEAVEEYLEEMVDVDLGEVLGEVPEDPEDLSETVANV
jgi:folate/biopterin transporter